MKAYLLRWMDQFGIDGIVSRNIGRVAGLHWNSGYRHINQPVHVSVVQLSDEAPLGFATRVVAQWQSRPAPSLLSLWQWHSWRVLKAVVVLLLVTLLVNTAVEMGEPSAPPLAAPAVEETVTDAISML